MIKIPHEHQILHPRAAHWITGNGLLYLHEFKVPGGIIDFLTIHPETGHVSIIECKMSIMSTGDAMRQVDSYARSFDLGYGSKIILFLDHPGDKYIAQAEARDFEVYALGREYPTTPVLNRAVTLDPFDDVFWEWYGVTVREYLMDLAKTRAEAARKESLTKWLKAKGWA
jgi:hypothetical protein